MRLLPLPERFGGERDGRLTAQRLIQALEDGAELVSANELLRQRDVRKTISIEPQALELARGQGCAQAYRSLADIGRWQNGNVKRQECRHRGLAVLEVG